MPGIARSAPGGLDDDGNGIVDDVHGADFIGADVEAPLADEAALKAAACELGKVRKPRPRKARRPAPLVVRFSTPAAGARPASGKVKLTLGPKFK